VEVNELVDWLIAHRHDDVRALSEIRVESTYKGKRRAYELVPAVFSPTDGLFDHNDIERGPYWKRVAP
jgi:hypothetical protein